MRFSRRTGWDVTESGFAAAVRVARASGRPLLDLTVSNPTASGFRYDAEALLPPLAQPETLQYEADPLGMPSARRAVAEYYAAHGAEVAIRDLLLTTSTSEAYGFLFRLLCNAGDEVLIARPSYPLFDFLADLEDVRLRSYPLFYDHGWWMDFHELERRIGPRTRALVVVHPNNPTGHATDSPERARLQQVCARHGLALIVDEVFLDYPWRPGVELRSFAAGDAPVLTFVLSGMSKVAGLPQMKVAWAAVRGPEAEREEAMARLEVIADTLLSMNAPVQLALPAWMTARHTIQREICDRIRLNLLVLRSTSLAVLDADGGWSAVLRLPQRCEETGVAEELLARDVVVQAGDLFGFAESGRVVVSLLTPPDVFRQGVDRIAGFAQD